MRTPYIVKYPFPLRQNLVVSLALPDDLQAEEAERLCAFVSSLAIDQAKEES